MKITLKKHQKAVIGMLLLILGFFLFNTPVGQPSQMYAVVIHTQDSPATTTFALQNGVEVIFPEPSFKKGDKIKLWVKKMRFSKKRVFSLSPDFEAYVLAQQEF